MGIVRTRKKKQLYTALASAGATAVIAAGGFYWFYQESHDREIELKNKYQAQVEELEDVAAQSVLGYALKEPVARGDVITGDDIKEVYVSEAGAGDLFLYNLIDSPDHTFYARADLSAKTTLTNAMVYEDEKVNDDTREIEYSFIELPSKIAVGEYIDIRIQFPTADEYVLLSKKKVKDVVGTTVWFDIDEGELLTMSSAIVDAYLEQGTKIYAVNYVDDQMQPKASMTYPVKDNVKELISSSPNIVERAKLNLEKQNRARLEQNLTDMGIDQKATVETGAAAVQSKVNQENAQRTAEERVNALNEQSQTQTQEDLVGGSE